MGRNRPVVAAIILLGFLFISTDAGAQRLDRALASCQLDGVPGEVLCGVVHVLERRELPDGRRIGLNVVVLRAESTAPLADPVVFLAGGAVIPATRMAPFVNRALADVRRSRDIVLVDQRGTGESNPLHCTFDLPAPSGLEPDTVEIRRRVDACTAEIASRADPRAYSTTRAMHDLEQVRNSLGYGQLNLWGMSYGTKAAREYLRLYPTHVRSLVLSGVVPRARAWWGDQPANAERILREYFRLCANDSRCGEAFPAPREDLERLMSRLQREPVPVDASVAISVNDVRRVVAARLSESWSAVTIPLVVRSGLDGDLSFLAPPPRPAVRAIPVGILFGITCSEEFPRQDAERLRAGAQDTFLGAIAALQHLAVCAAWPVWDIEPGLWEEITSEVPTLILSGALDHITPPEYAHPVAAQLPNSRVVVLPLRGHNDFDPCVGELLQSFIRQPDASPLDVACLERTPPLRFPTTREELRR